MSVIELSWQLKTLNLTYSGKMRNISVSVRGGHAVADYAVSCGYVVMRCGFLHVSTYFSICALFTY